VRVYPAHVGAEQGAEGMDGRVRADGNASWTRARLLRAAVGGGAIVAGGALMGARSDSGTLLAAQLEDADAKILNFFLLLEYVQEGFYREAAESGRLTAGRRQSTSRSSPNASEAARGHDAAPTSVTRSALPGGSATRRSSSRRRQSADTSDRLRISRPTASAPSRRSSPSRPARSRGYATSPACHLPRAPPIPRGARTMSSQISASGGSSHDRADPGGSGPR
jgi:hypothetical protein